MDDLEIRLNTLKTILTQPNLPPWATTKYATEYIVLQLHQHLLEENKVGRRQYYD